MRFVPQFLELLKSPRSFHRDHLPGHITASAWIVDEEKEHALLVHHAKLNRWLQPGGHADGDEDVLNVAAREVDEETGLSNLQLLIPGIFDIDIHPIPARKDFHEHLHYDVRFAFVASRKIELKISDESHDLKWVKLKDVAEMTEQNSSILRMIRKTIES
jgi:8-oxo-dGTP pyrophosphatase MutT (NUDIX family)